jgi:hypothetical protein
LIAMPSPLPKLAVLAALLLAAGLHAAEPGTPQPGARVKQLLARMSRADTPGVWHRYDVTLAGRYVTVALDGKTVIDHQEIPGITGGALDSHEGEDGPLVLQGSEDGQVSYRNIVVTPALKQP